MSLPSRERGLKLTILQGFALSSVVAPFAGAWIEMYFVRFLLIFLLSLPSRERGLKYGTVIFCCKSQMSLPSRERGLKFWDACPIAMLRGRSLRGSVD